MRRAARARRLNALRAAASRDNTSVDPEAPAALTPLSASSSSSSTTNNNNNVNPAVTSNSTNGVFTLMLHGPEFNNGEYVVLNPECFPGVKPMDLVELRQPERALPRLIVQVATLAPVRGKLQVSLLKELAAQFGLEAFQPVAVSAVDARSATADYMEVTFKDQYLSSADIWRVKVALFGKCVYVGKTVECLGIRSQVEGLLAGGAPAFSGVIGDATKIIVRSRSSRLFWLVHMSAEMWEFAPDGELYYEKLIDRLLRDIIARWTAASVTHSVTLIVFSRSFYDADQFPKGFDPCEPPFSMPNRQCYDTSTTSESVSGEDGVPVAAKRYAPTIHLDPHSGRLYEDFYKVVVLSYTGPDWGQLRTALKKEFATYHTTHRWRGPDEYMPAEYELCANESSTPIEIYSAINNIWRGTGTIQEAEALEGEVHSQINDNSDGSKDGFVKWTRLPFGVPARAVDGNVLEAINVTLNVLDKHHMDRDLNRTGQSIVLVTAGSSVFNVREQLAEVTQQRMMDNGVGMDMISLAAPPLHVVPLFIYRDPRPSATTNSTDDALTRVSRPRKASLHGDDLDGDSVDDGLPSAKPSARPDRSMVPHPDTDCRYQVPHWVNLTFLDFDCKCPSDSKQQHSTWMSMGRHESGYASPLFSHRTHACKCQRQLNQQFMPLPPFRMFDASASKAKVSPLPAALRNVIPGYPRRAAAAVEEKKSVMQSLEDELKSMEMTSLTECQTLRAPTSYKDPETEYHDELSVSERTVAAFPSSEWQISRSPDYALSIAPTIKRTATNLNLSLITREALLEYDDEVFTSCVGSLTSPSISLRGVSGTPMPEFQCLPSLEEARSDTTSKTFDGDMSSLLKANQRKAFNRGIDWASDGDRGSRQSVQAGSARSNHSTISSVLSPRDDNHLSTPASTPLLPQRSTSGTAERPSESSQGRAKYAPTDPVAIMSRKSSASASASEPAQQPSNSGMSPPSPPSPTLAPSYALLGKSFDSSQQFEHSSLKVERGQGHMVSPDRATKDRWFAPSRFESCHSSFSPAISTAFSHRSDQSSFQPLQRAVTMTRVSETSTTLAPTSTTRGPTPGTRASQQLRKISPSKFTYTGMKRGQSEVFQVSTPSTTTGAMSGFAHLRGATPESNGLNDASANEVSKPSVNPFHYSAEALDASSQHFSVDRRRWSHLFPVRYQEQILKGSDVVHKFAASKKLLYVGPDWKSLVTPAILPLTTDYFPSPKELRDLYTESFYTLTLPSTSRFDSVPKYNNHDELLIEMICQRLACDFQLVLSGDSSGDTDTKGSRARQSVTSSSVTGSGGGGRYSTRRLDQAPDSHTLVYHLSTGHRIHQLIYDPERQTIEVKQYFQRSAAQRELAAVPAAALAPLPPERVSYRYSVWVDATQSFHPLQQEFHPFPTHDENWNATDHLLCGYHDHMSDRSKCRRVRFAVVPPTFPAEQGSSGEADAIAATYAAKFARFLDYLQSRVAPNDDGSLETISVTVEMDTTGVGHRPATVLPKGFNSRCYKVCCRTSSASVSPSSFSSSLSAVVAPGGPGPLHPPASSGSKARSEDTRTEWVLLNLEDTMDVTRTYHLDVRWLACSGIVTDEFVGAVKRKAKQAGLELRRVPEYSSVAFLQIHPLIAPVLVPFPSAPPADKDESTVGGKRKARVVRMVEALGFVMDDERIADASGIGYGLGIEREEAITTAYTTVGNALGTTAAASGSAPRVPRRSTSLTTRMLLAKFRKRGYQQFLHRQLPVFVRITHAGLVWVPSYEYEEKLDSARTDALFRELCQQLGVLDRCVSKQGVDA